MIHYNASEKENEISLSGNFLAPASYVIFSELRTIFTFQLLSVCVSFIARFSHKQSATVEVLTFPVTAYTSQI